MLDIAFHELSRGRAQDVVARDVGRRVHEGHDILQLVTETVSAARLIKSGAAPETAAERLINQPAIEQKICRKLGRFHLDRAQEPVPPVAGFLECGFDVRGIAKSVNEGACFFFVVRLPKKKGYLGALSRVDLDHDLHGCARVEASANVAGQSFVLHRGRIAQRAVAPDKHGAITGERSRRWSRSGKSDAFAKFRVVGIAGNQALALQVPFRHHVHAGFLGIGSENKSGVGGDGHLPPARRVVAQAQSLKAHRQAAGIIDRHEGEQPLFDRVAVVFKGCVTLPMSRAIGVLLPDRLGRGRPNDADVVIADVDSRPGRIGDRIVKPRCEAIVLAISAPDKFGARLGNKRAELWIGHDVDPGKRRLPAGTQIDDKFLSVLGKTAETVEVFQLHERQGRGGLFVELPGGH